MVPLIELAVPSYAYNSMLSGKIVLLKLKQVFLKANLSKHEFN